MEIKLLRIPFKRSNHRLIHDPLEFSPFIQIILQGGLQGADVTNRPVQYSKTARVILIYFFNKRFSEQFG